MRASLKKKALKFAKKVNPSLSVLVVMLALATVVFFALLSSRSSTNSPERLTKVHEIGEVVSVDNKFSVTVAKATFDNSIGPKLHLPDSQKVLVLDVQVTNLSDEKLNYLPIIHTFLRNDQGDTYTFTPGLTENTMPAELIEPGQTLRGDLAFVVPAGYMPFWFYFDARFDNQGALTFNIVK